MARGNFRNPELRRYDEVECEPAIYLIEAGSAVKVGCAVSARPRLRDLHTKLAKAAMTPGRFHVFPVASRLLAAETRCIRALGAVARAVPGSREYFVDITFDAAVQLIASELKEAA